MSQPKPGSPGDGAGDGSGQSSKSGAVKTDIKPSEQQAMLMPIAFQPVRRAPQVEADRRITSSWHEPSLVALLLTVGATLIFFGIALFAFDWADAARQSALLAAGLGVLCVIIGLLKLLTAEGRRGWHVWLIIGTLFFVLGYFVLPNAILPLHYAQAQVDEESSRFDLAYTELHLAGVKPCDEREIHDLLRWAESDRDAGHYAAAVDHYALLIQTCPTTDDAKVANAEIGKTRLAWGDQLVSTGDYADAVKVFEQIQRLYPASPIALAARQEAAAALVAWGDRDEHEGRYADALAHYQLELATYPETAYATSARTGAAQTLYDWGQWATRNARYDEAVQHFNQLVDTYPGTPQADQASTLLRAPQPVVGRLTHRNGDAAAGVQVRLSSEYQFGGGSYTVGGTQFTAVTDSTGIFRLNAVPPGTYLLEWTDAWGHYTTFVDASGQPIDVLVVPQLHPLTVGDVIIDPLN